MNNNVIQKPLIPALSGMTKVAWNESNDEVVPSTNAEWYNYSNNKWANAKNSDGSYFVWIPRYAYKIIYFDTEANKNLYIADNTNETAKAGIIGYSTRYGIVNKAENKIIPNTEPIGMTETVATASYADYIPHPAFLGIGNEELGGGFGTSSKGITGIWVAKYEMSREDSTDNGATWTQTTEMGNVAINANAIRMVSKPGVASWRGINIANCYQNSRNYAPTKESHLIKNSEWGAVAYLTHSKYGRNATKITINNNGGTYYTGGEIGAAYKTNINQSSTGNITGIYDLGGNAREYVAAYNKAYSRTGNYFGGAGGNTEKDHRPVSGVHFAYSLNGNSDKYVTAYSNSTSTLYASEFEDFTSDGKDISHIGDGIHEVWLSGYYAWFKQANQFVGLNVPFYDRGGWYNTSPGAGVFASYYYTRRCI